MVVFVIPATNFPVSRVCGLKPVVERAPTTGKKMTNKILHEYKQEVEYTTVFLKK